MRPKAGAGWCSCFSQLGVTGQECQMPALILSARVMWLGLQWHASAFPHCPFLMSVLCIVDSRPPEDASVCACRWCFVLTRPSHRWGFNTRHFAHWLGRTCQPRVAPGNNLNVNVNFNPPLTCIHSSRPHRAAPMPSSRSTRFPNVAHAASRCRESTARPPQTLRMTLVRTLLDATWGPGCG